MKVVLVGAGGHAKAIVEAVEANGGTVVAYVDPQPADWLQLPHYSDDDDSLPEGAIVIGIGGTDPRELERRISVLERYAAADRELPSVVHPTAWMSRSAERGSGVVALAGAVVQPGARLGDGTIVNTRAVVEHDSEIGAGAHIAPGAIVLGGCRIGRCAIVGAGAVVLPMSEVADGALVPAASRFPR